MPGTSAGGEVSTGALKFDGTNDYIGVPYNFPASIFTLSMWVKSTLDRSQGLFTSGPIGSGTPFLLIRRLAGGVITVYTPNSYYSTSGSVTSNGNWFHLAVVRNGSSGALYINGINTLSLSYSAGGSNTGTYFGVDAFATNKYWSGMLDDARIYNIALSAAQIQAMYENQTAAPTSGLVGHWKLDDGSGTTAVDSAGSNNGTLTNGPTWEVQVPPRLSRNRNTEDWSVLFDGVEDYISTSYNPNISGDLSISAWIKPQQMPLYQMIVSSNQYYLYFGVMNVNSSVGQLRWDTFSNGTFQGTEYIWWGQWTHVAVTRSSGVATLWVNGINSGSKADTTAFNGTLGIGIWNYNNTYPFNGNIKDVRIYNSALAQSDITKLANGQESTAVPVARWRLNDGTGTTATDSIGSNHGTLTNGPTWSGDVPQWHRQIIQSSHAAVFDGVNDYVVAVNNSARNTTSVSFWFKLSTAGTLVGVFSYGNSSNDGTPYWLIQNDLASSGYLRTYTYGSGYVNITNSLTLGVWHHYYETRVGGTGRAYIDGQLRASFTAIADYNYANVYFGSSYSTTLNGSLDDIRIYNRALTAAEVLDLWQGYANAAGLIGHWKLDNNYNDSVGSNNGTESGGVTFTTGVPGTL